jgi:hypothetical protein
LLEAFYGAREQNTRQVPLHLGPAVLIGGRVEVSIERSLGCRHLCR